MRGWSQKFLRTNSFYLLVNSIKYYRNRAFYSTLLRNFVSFVEYLETAGLLTREVVFCFQWLPPTLSVLNAIGYLSE